MIIPLQTSDTVSAGGARLFGHGTHRDLTVVEGTRAGVCGLALVVGTGDPTGVSERANRGGAVFMAPGSRLRFPSALRLFERVVLVVLKLRRRKSSVDSLAMHK